MVVAGLFGSLFCARDMRRTVADLRMLADDRRGPLGFARRGGAAACGRRSSASWVGLFYSLSLSGFGYQTGWTQWLYWLAAKTAAAARPGRPRRVSLAAAPGLLELPRSDLVHAPHDARPRAADRRLDAATSSSAACSRTGGWRSICGDEYREYASRVPGYPGDAAFGPLSRWPQAARSTPKSQRVAADSTAWPPLRAASTEQRPFDRQPRTEGQHHAGQLGQRLPHAVEDEQHRRRRHVAVLREHAVRLVERIGRQARGPRCRPARMCGPPGWTIQPRMSSIVRPRAKSQSSSHSRSDSRMMAGTSADSVISKPWSPIRQVITSAESGSTCDR